MRIPRHLLNELIDHAQREAPRECCGLIAAQAGDAVRVYPATNAADSSTRYAIDGLEQMAIQMDIDARGRDLAAIYHSHTIAAAVPSQADLDLAAHPDVLYVIVGVAELAPTVRAFQIRDRQATEVDLPVLG